MYICVLFVSYHICEAEGTIKQEALSSTSQQDLMSDHGAAQHLPVKPQNKNDNPYQEWSAIAVCLTVNMTRYLRAASPSIPSSGLGGSLERAWEMKRRGTAHQCLQATC